MEQHRPHQPRLQGKNNLTPAQWLSARQRWRGHSSKNVPETGVHHDGIPSVNNGYRVCPTQPSHASLPGNACRQLAQNGNDWAQRTLPTAPREAKMTLSLSFAAGSKLTAPTLQKRGSLICCSGRMNEIIGNWNRNMCYRQGDIDSAHQSLTTKFTFPPKNKHGISIKHCRRVPRGEQNDTPPWKRNKFMGLVTYFKKEMQQTELHARHLVHVEVPVNSLLRKRNTAQLNRVRKQRRCDQTRERPYHKTIPVVFASRFLQIGDNQGPNADDVGNDVDQMGHTQIVGQNGLLQSGARGHPIPRFSAL